MVILAGEIGKTESKLALFSHKKDDSTGKIIIDPDVEPIIKNFETKYEVSELQNMIETFLTENYDDRQEDIYGACFSIAAPINKGEATLSDDDQTVTFAEQDFRQKLPYKNLPMTFLNDMEAIGYGIFLGDGESNLLEEIHSQETSPNPRENKALMLVTDGLGAANWFYCDEEKGDLHPMSSEWGHEDFTTRIENEEKLLKYLRNRRRHYQDNSPVSKEYALSQRGLQRIYQSLENPEIYDNKSFKFEPNEIIDKALQGDSLCKQSLDLFMAIWGTEAGNLALTFKSEGGIYIVTDLPIPLEKFKEGAFMEAFINKEPEEKGFQNTLKETPIKLIRVENLGLQGAAEYAIKKGFVTKGKFAIMRANQ